MHPTACDVVPGRPATTHERRSRPKSWIPAGSTTTTTSARQEKVAYIRIDGQTSDRQRNMGVEAFQVGVWHRRVWVCGYPTWNGEWSLLC